MTATSTRIHVSPSRETALLPRELWLLYPLAPVAASLLLIDGLLALPAKEMGAQLLGMCVPFLAMAVVMYPLYRWLMPALLPRLGGRFRRGVAHLVVVTGAALVVGALVLGPHNRLCTHGLLLWQFEISMVLISWLMTFPPLLLHAQRRRITEIEQHAQAERQTALKAQLEALQARTNPHFFFNSINTVATLISEDPVLAERTLERLADLFRYALDSAKTQTVPLSREFEMVRDYLAIQQARFGDRLQTTVTLDPSLADTPVPPLLLQPVVENAILHGLSSRGGGRVDVVARRDAGLLYIEVRDDGPGPGASAHRGNQVSTRELKERLTLAFGPLAAFVLESAPGGGCLARLALPVP
jgi:two-component system sensor histidine kinase AlgZ